MIKRNHTENIENSVFLGAKAPLGLALVIHIDFNIDIHQKVCFPPYECINVSPPLKIVDSRYRVTSGVGIYIPRYVYIPF